MTPGPPPKRRELAAVAALALAWLAATAWARPLMLPDEGRYVGVAWEMLRSGDWLTPTLNGLPYFHKPPLFYWITAASLALFGEHEWAARAAPIVGAWLGAMALFLFARRWWGERAARLALLALLLQPLFFLGGQFANLDMLVAGCITTTIVLLADAALCIEGGLPYRKALAAAYAMAALGVLAKGLIGFVIPALVVGAWLLLRRRWRVLGSMLWWPGALIFLLLAVPWFAAMQGRFADFLDYFFVVQHFKRFATGGFNNVEPFWFYPLALLALSLPWLPWLARPLRQALRRTPQRERMDEEPSDTRAEIGAIRLLLVLWVAIVVLFFSLPSSKLLGYVLPAVPPLALLMADGYLMAIRARPLRARRLWQAGAAISLLVNLGAVTAAALHASASTKEFGALLLERRHAGEPLLMLQNYFFDLPFYARTSSPIEVVDDWASAEVARHDNWRKELADAGRFAPQRAAASLIEPAAFAARLCAVPVSWVIAPSHPDARLARLVPLLTGAQVVLSGHHATLWRIERAQLVGGAAATALRCAETPSGGPADR